MKHTLSVIKHFVLTLTLLTLISGTSFSQTGPGGVGNSSGTGGQPANRIWYSADRISGLNDGEPVSSLSDVSGNSNTATQGVSANQPTFKANVVNGKPALRFSGDQFITSTNAMNLPATGGHHYFLVVKANATPTGGSVTGGDGSYILDRNFSGFSGGGNPLASLKVMTGGVYGFQKRTDGGSGINTINSTSSVSTSTFQIVDYARIRGTAYRIYVNGSQEGSLADGDGNTTPDPVRIGRHYNATNGGLNGDIPEVLIYGTSLNEAQRLIVENYLSTKYNISISNDLYSYDAAYGNDLAGIGRYDNSNQHYSATSSILNINTASFAGNNRYLLFAHNNASATPLTNVSGDDFRGDATNTRRIAREWRVQKTAGITAVTAAFDITGLSLPSSEWTWALFIDANGDGDFVDAGDTFTDLTVAGSTASASVDIPTGATVTLGAIRRAISFSAATSQGFENATQYPTLTVNLNYPYTGTTVSFNYTVTAGSATVGSDYTTNTSSATISAGNTSVNLNAGSPSNYALKITNDGSIESTETVSITLSSPTNAFPGTTTTQTYSILDDDEPRKISFTSAAVSQAEGSSGSYTLNINLNLTSTDGGVVVTASNSSVDVTITGGTATVGTDGSVTTSNSPPASGSAGIQSTTSATGTITFNTVSCPNGSANMVGVGILSINGDALFETNETLVLSLGNPQSCALNATGNLTTTVTLTDDDTAPSVLFSTSSSNVSEGAGTTSVSVELSQASGSDITVNFSAAAGTPAATNGSDYAVITTSPLTIPAGSTSGSIQVSIMNDGTEERDEQVVLSLTSAAPGGVTIGSPSTHTLTILDNDSMGDTGPGGVGSSTQNRVWYRADAGTSTTTNGASVTSWSDQSGNNNTATEATNAPVYQGNAVNGMPALRFNGNQFLTSGPLSINGTGGSHYIIVTKANAAPVSGGSGDGNGWYILDRNPSGAGNPLASLKVIGGHYAYQKRLDDGTSINAIEGTSAVSQSAYQIVDYVRERGTRYRLFVNGTEERNTPDNDGNITPDAVRIGRHATATNGGLNGDIPEVIIYGTSLNPARRIIVENYLSAKYGIALSTGDYYAGDTPGNGDYDYDVAGIGTTDGTLANSHRSASNSKGLILAERNGSLNGTNEFLVCGHNTPANSITNQGLDMVTAEQRWSRSWYIHKTGAIDATLTFDFSDGGFGGATPGTAENYVLLYRSNTSSTFLPVVTGATAVSGDQVSFDLINTQLSDGYYTIGTTGSDISLPVELTKFEAVYDGNGVKLNWTTATETDNQGFIVSRAERKDGEYKQIASYQSHPNLKGQGTTATETSYSVGDYAAALQPGQTYFYKLEDVNLTGQRNTLEVKEVKLPEAYSLGQNYPNPFNPTTTINFSLMHDSKTVLEVYNILGQKVATLINTELKAGVHTFNWNAAGQASGVYFYRLRSGSFTATKKMLLLK